MNEPDDNSNDVIVHSFEEDIWNLYKKDNYMKHCIVRDNIEPIALEEEIHILKKEEGHTFKLSEILESLDNKKEEEEEAKSDTSSLEYIEQEKKEEEEEEENGKLYNGVYLHEVNIIDNTNYFECNKIYDENIYPISILGDMYINNIIQFKDISPYHSIYKVHKVEWFLSVDINENRIHEIIPFSVGKNIQIPFESLGKYIFCKAYRRIYKNNPFKEKDTNTVFDPHTYINKPVRFKCNPEYIEKYSLTCKGPVLISIDLAFKVLTYLCAHFFSTKMNLHDPLNNLRSLFWWSNMKGKEKEEAEDDDEEEDDNMTYTTSSISQTGEDDNKIYITNMTINFDEIRFIFYDSPDKKNKISTSNSDKNNNNYNYNGDNIRCNPLERKEMIFNLYEVEFRISNKNDGIILIICKDIHKYFTFEKYKMITIKPFHKNICINELWIILLAFKSAYSYKNLFKKYPKTIFRNTNISFVQNMVNNYIIKSYNSNKNKNIPFHKINTIFNEL
ncbi:hypothetical protein PGSY75_0528300 [Plasmodium gaboni]|uniref:Uncharacterized protein n=1 Tax=Plasmodium gaboni TaxID=647221 RepID=A0A151LTH1_9APIC|nr:hypothetical protein PGSY75_0528300 [Plasmodium gaboni]KYO02477.1 hypothetical protein PGSY75_0528300 [Plasmodium gaboni]